MSSFPHRFSRLLALAILACLLLPVSRSWAQRRWVDKVTEGPNSFFVSSASFFDPQVGDSWLEVFYRAANDHLQFIKETDGYRATFQIVCVVYDDKDHQVTGDILPGTQWAKTYDETNSRREFASGNFRFSLPAGKYKLNVWLEGEHGGRMVSTEFRATVPGFDASSLMLSDILLADEIHDSEMGSGSHVKNGLTVIPSVDRRFSDLRPQISFYYEIYDLAAEGSAGTLYDVIYEVIGPSEEVVLADSSTLTRTGELSYGHGSFMINSLEEGEHLLRLTARDARLGRTVQRETYFFLRWSSLGQVAKDYEEAIEQLRYIATEDEYRELKKALGEERKEAWLEFWADRDPTPGTPENEMKSEYYRRIEYSNARFSVASPGWKSDRGRIYIVYGHPDEIERHPMEIGLKPYEIWHYYSTNHFFYFVDVNGYGDYKLVRWR